jgi:hypothetical protein
MSTRVINALLAAAVFTAAVATAAAPPQPPAKDPAPRACVDCHTKDMQLSVLLQKGTPKSAAKVQPIAPKKLTGKHPPVPAAVKDIPAKCLPCHAAGSKIAPPFSQMMHVIHLTTGAATQCTACHKLNATTGVMSVPNASE